MSAIVKAGSDAIDIAGELPQIFRLATALKQAGGFLPSHIRNEGELVAVILAGREIGLPPMTALRSIVLIKGKVTLSADIQLALMIRAGARFKWVSDGSNDCAELHITRPGQETHVSRFTMDDAKRAQLTGGENWRKYPSAMLRARCVSSAARAAFPDVLAGVYVPEEIEDEQRAERREQQARQPVRAESTTQQPAKLTAVATPAAETSAVADAAVDGEMLDEYGLAIPNYPCPVVSKQAKEYGGKSWMDVPEWMVEKWLVERGDKMNEAQLKWATYIRDRRQARKAREAAQAAMLDANADGGGYLADDGDAEPANVMANEDAAQ